MELRFIIGKDGEEYINIRDLAKAMQKQVWRLPLPTISGMYLVRRFLIELITARRSP